MFEGQSYEFILKTYLNKFIIKFAKSLFLDSMKNNAAVRGFVISVLAVVFAFGVYFLFLAKKNYYLVDNPSQNNYYFKINNGEENIVAAVQSVKVNMQKGANKIAVFDAEKKLLFDSTFQVKKLRGFLNIAHEVFYI